MRDEQTGTFWQQISGRAISGPLAGQSLKRIPSDELTLALWKTEQPDGSVLKDVAADASGYSPKDWDVKMRKLPTVISFAEHGLSNREIMLGVNAFGESRAWRYQQVIDEKLIEDRVGSEPAILLVGPDNQSVRVFRDTLSGSNSASDIPHEFFRTPDGGMI